MEDTTRSSITTAIAGRGQVTPEGSVTYSHDPSPPTEFGGSTSSSAYSSMHVAPSAAAPNAIPALPALPAYSNPGVLGTNAYALGFFNGATDNIVIQTYQFTTHPDVPYGLSEEEDKMMGMTAFNFLQMFGPILNVYKIPTCRSSPTITWFCEMQNLQTVDRVVRASGALHGQAFLSNGILISVLPVSNALLRLRDLPDLTFRGLPIGTVEGDMQLGHYERAMIRRVRPTGRGRDVLDQSSRPHPLQLDATPRQAYIDLFCPHLYRASSHYPNVNDQDHDNNRVITYNIKAGTDVRTTIMLRNIPNSIKQMDLIKLLNDIVPGLYDFVYLRIDFANGCNVGYGFINFVKCQFILDFIDAVAFKRWANSTKMAEVKYATIQGVEALITKFRNSAVMRQHPSAQPKLFYSLSDYDCDPKTHCFLGYEKAFPDYDNCFKLNQSLQNARTQGLFSPSRKSHTCSDNRNRKGQWDRGNTWDLQEQQRVTFNNSILHHGYLPRMMHG